MEASMKMHQPLCAIAIVALGAHSLAQTTPPAAREASVPTFLLAPSAKVIGLSVQDAAEKNVGEIGDLLLDPRTGEIRYAVIEAGGFLGMGEDSRVVPWAFVQVVRDEKDADKIRARTNLTETLVKAAPACKADTVFDAELDRRIETAFGRNDQWAYTGEGKPLFARLTQLDGVKIKDPTDKEVGSVKDLILAPSHGCVAYAVVETTKEAGDSEIALAFSKLNYAIDAEKKLVLATTPVEITRFRTAPKYDADDWKRMSSTPWLTDLCAYYSADPFWKTARFAKALRLPEERP
jgi:sporulation protein YlmC with PRC-barrel domain